MSKRAIYCRGDNTFHYKSELPKSLQPFCDYLFSSGGIAGDDFVSFNKKFHNAVKKQLPAGWEIDYWITGHYYCSAVFVTPEKNYIYLSIPDVRFHSNEWFSHILIRTMAHSRDWTGRSNHYCTLFNLTDSLEKLNR